MYRDRIVRHGIYSTTGAILYEKASDRAALEKTDGGLLLDWTIDKINVDIRAQFVRVDETWLRQFESRRVRLAQLACCYVIGGSTLNTVASAAM